MSKSPVIIAIVGRPNVGKSTLFNSVLGRRNAVVDDEPGVTRDRNYCYSEKYSIPFYMVDTGGLESSAEGDFANEIKEQTLLAVEQADYLIALFDGQAGVQPDDRGLVQEMRLHDKPMTYVVNKCDGVEQNSFAADFYSLGVDDFRCISALHGLGVADLVEEVLQSFPDYESRKQSFRAKKSTAKEKEEELRLELERWEKVNLERESQGEHEEEIAAEGESEEIPEFAPVFVPETSEQTAEEYLAEFRLKPKEHSRSKKARATGDRRARSGLGAGKWCSDRDRQYQGRNPRPAQRRQVDFAQPNNRREKSYYLAACRNH